MLREVLLRQNLLLYVKLVFDGAIFAYTIMVLIPLGLDCKQSFPRTSDLMMHQKGKQLKFNFKIKCFIIKSGFGWFILHNSFDEDIVQKHQFKGMIIMMQ